ncbi:ABC transporter substrate-binding protein [Methylobacillus gramineus]|uniref:ABC transporter substrate-binding protein n=1 Tax=Methylobacillus gramineus TaxID=755169 RepID=UPI001CFF9DFB|nr:ABC transporter substrate-binding protein [Methylobacillus gramineus]MCB5184409.1 ABC transporter substrate-binding protein [Methylobacillus gramineus]
MLKKILPILAIALPILSAGKTFAEDLPKVVRIAAVVYNIAGKTTYLNGQVVLTEGGLEQTLKDKGVRIEWVPASHSAVGPIINEGFASGKVDFASYGDLPPIILNASKPAVQLVAPWGRSGNSYLVVPIKSTAASLEDLKGKRIALHRGRPWEIAFANLVESKGLSFKDFKIVNVNPQVGASALASGSVDAFFGLNDAHLLEDRKVGRIIWSTKNSPPDWKLMGGLWASNDFVKRYPELTQVIVTAYVKSNYWTSQDKNKDKYIKQYGTNALPESVVRRDYDNDIVSWKDRWSPMYDQALYEHYRRAISYAREASLIRSEVNIDQLLNPHFVEQALKQLDLEHYWQGSALKAERKGV